MSPSPDPAAADQDATAATARFLLLTDYRTVAVIGYALFGVSLAFYATPSTDAALSSLPMNQSGSGSGLYKTASSLGAALGVAISGAILRPSADTPTIPKGKSPRDPQRPRHRDHVKTFRGRVRRGAHRARRPPTPARVVSTRGECV